MKLVFDIETNPVDFTKGDWLHDIHTVHCISVQNVDTDKIGTYYDSRTDRRLGDLGIKYAIASLREADEIIGHNIIQFDIPVLKKLYNFDWSGRVTDTLVLSRLLYPDRSGGHSLRSWGERLNYGKGEPPSFEEYSQQMREYCEQDVSLNGRVYRVLASEYSEWMEGSSFRTESDFARIISAQESIGFKFNTNMARRLVEEWEKEIDNIDDTVTRHLGGKYVPDKLISSPFKINGDLSKRALDVASKSGIDVDTIGGPFTTITLKDYNLESKSQQKEILLGLGWIPENTTPTGQPRIDSSIKQVGLVGEKLLKRNVMSHRRSQTSGLMELVDDYGRIHGGGNPCGTPTGRMRHSRIVNIPRMSSPYGKELRELFMVPATKKLVGYDAAALELRILAHYIGDTDYVNKVTTTDRANDAHTLAARAAGSDDRELGKTINYALIYGAGDWKLGSLVGGSEADGAAIRAHLYKEIIGFEKLVNRVKQVGKKGYLLGLDKRRLWCRPRVSPLNTLIQGGGAIYMKTVAVVLDELTRHLQAFKVIDIHDEAQWECPVAECDALGKAITEAFQIATTTLELRCPQEAEIKIGNTWAETH